MTIQGAVVQKYDTRASGKPIAHRRASDRWFPSLWRPELLHSNIDTRIVGTQVESIFHEFVHNSAHFPFIYLLFEFLSPFRIGPPFALHAAALVIGSVFQAVFLGSAEFHKHPKPLLGNLIAPTFCAVVLVSYAVLTPDFHLSITAIFFGYSLLIGSAQEIRFRVTNIHVKHLSILFENLLRTSVVLLLILKAHGIGVSPAHSSEKFFSEFYHLYIFLVIPAIGLITGMGNINAYRYMTILRLTAIELKKYSEWLLGPDLLKRSLHNPTALDLRNADRTVVFMDIRGFTEWSDSVTPGAVVELINSYFQTAEDVLKGSNAIKVELTGDEILAAFYLPDMAVLMALEAKIAVESVLGKEGLDVGVGINTGPIIEGLVGGRNLKKFSVMGDTVNTGKRISDIAMLGEILLSESTRTAMGSRIAVGERRTVQLKGKRDSVNVYPLLGLEEVDAKMPHAATSPLANLVGPAPQE